MKFAVAQNAAIIEDNGLNVRFHPRCPYCGYLNHTFTSGTAVVEGGRMSVGSFSCQKCSKHFEIAVSRR